MAVATKKYKLFKVCKELNVGMDTLSSFLEEKGVKIKGPNTSFPEEIYIDILEQFAKDKESADILLKRKMQQAGAASDHGIPEEEDIVPKKKPAYVEIIEKSIEEGVEEIKKEEVEEEKPKKKKVSKAKKEEEPDKKDKVEKKSKETKKIKEEIKEKPTKAKISKDERIAEEKSTRIEAPTSTTLPKGGSTFTIFTKGILIIWMGFWSLYFSGSILT